MLFDRMHEWERQKGLQLGKLQPCFQGALDEDRTLKCRTATAEAAVEKLICLFVLLSFSLSKPELIHIIWL